MHLFKKVFVYLLAVFALSATFVSADDYEISEFNIKNISMPASFSVCTREKCDNSFLSILNANGYTFSSWKEDVMIPENIYICGRDSYGNAINLSINDPSTEKERKENIKYHRLMYDYNLYSTASKTKETVLVRYRDSLVNSGVNKRKIRRIRWFEKDELSTFTPYILGMYETEKGTFVTDYITIYNGNTVSISLTTKNEPKDKQLSFMSEIIKEIEYANDVDYSQAKQVYRQNQRVKLPERLETKQKRSKTLVGLSLAFISIVILSAIAITTTKIRRRNRSSRNSKFGRY